MDGRLKHRDEWKRSFFAERGNVQKQTETNIEDTSESMQKNEET